MLQPYFVKESVVLPPSPTSLLSIFAHGLVNAHTLVIIAPRIQRKPSKFTPMDRSMGAIALGPFMPVAIGERGLRA